jgi:hypothetical protein
MVHGMTRRVDSAQGADHIAILRYHHAILGHREDLAP